MFQLHIYFYILTLLLLLIWRIEGFDVLNQIICFSCGVSNLLQNSLNFQQFVIRSETVFVKEVCNATGCWAVATLKRKE